MPADTDHISAILMERHAENDPCARRDWGSAMLDRLQSYDTTRANKTVASAEQRRIAEAEHDFPAERLFSFGRIAEQELASLKALCVWVLQVGTWAQDDSQLNREEHRATQIAVEGIESATAVLEKNRRRRRLARVMTPVAEAVPVFGKALRLS